MLAALLALAACRGDEGGDPPPADSAAPVAAAETAAAAAADTGLALYVRRTGERAYVAYGHTRQPALQLTVEDGHNVLYGPAELEVRGGSFRTEFTVEPTDQPTVFAYVTDPGGQGQWVVAIALDRDEVRWGGPVDTARAAAAASSP